MIAGSIGLEVFLLNQSSGAIARLAVFLAIYSGAPGVPGSLLMAQEPVPPPQRISILTIEGEQAINNVRSRVSREPIVQVEDENRKPIAGALVTFTLPNNGPSGTFLNGSRVLTVSTDQKGQAVARGLRLNNNQGNFQIRVNASYRGQTASTTINQSIVAGAAAGAASGGLFGMSLPVTIAVLGAAAAGTAVGLTLGLRNGNNPTRVSVGQPTLP